MKRIVICCDGTWNRLDARKRTNVAKLSEAILGTAIEADGRAVTQVVYYLDGVGAGRGTGGLARATDRLLGGAFGWGLDALITEAYRFLVLNYEPGDEIYLFGFSRGAYCARSLCGLIRRAGIVERQHAGRIPEALALYRDASPGAATVGEKARRFRARYSAHVSTLPSWAEPDEATWRARAEPASNPEPLRLRLAYLGVWDTVGSLGVPKGLVGGALAATGPMRHYRFHDAKLSPLLDAARHAVAIDERRSDFEPTLWSLRDVEDEAGLDPANYPQEWFPGVHGAVGGGGADERLSSAALIWVLDGARARGLKVDGGMSRRWGEIASYEGKLDAGQGRGGITDWILRLRSRDRAAVGAFADVSDIARRRWRNIARYRPAPLAGLSDALRGWTDPLAEPPTPEEGGDDTSPSR
ncbi:MAG: peptidoglycan-binding protein [Rhodovulum sulfidophilum]|uniref:Peptidoglycan-binding protein n=1 Tax=Rhodovulum sulfidophilum TaxID=35806 RepID=A0A2W5NCU7_RHOSU|nr:MAG: peptidoglycan-binding protein [Rhodovulum sulfidophilum]